MWGPLVVTRSAPQGVAVLGVVTDRDLVIEVLARGRDGTSVPIGSLLSGRLVAVPFDATLSDAIAAMEGEGVRRLLVTGTQQELIGMISVADLIDALASDMARLALSLRRARDREVKTGLPASLTVDGRPLILPNDSLVPSWLPEA